ncbi:MAG TPA: galactokinase [Herpetosiphonaceae bacterium]|nr:galactokinase [Herpetosiphonaceae bacterium]
MEKQPRVTVEAVREQFAARLGREPVLVARAPGRVNLIGEHTDYNDGFVLPAAIDRAAYAAVAPRTDRRLRVWAAQYQQEATLELDNVDPNVPQEWAIYVLGMAALIERDGHRLQGADMLIDGDVPGGAGLSSSAALENAVGAALAALSDLSIPPLRLAQLGQLTENQFAGVNSGIMDQMISALGQADHALLIDCRSYDYRPIAMPSNVRILVCDSKVSRELAGSAYNERRAQCEEAVKRLQAVLPGIKALRDVTPEQLSAHADLLPPLILRRARHVVGENGRTLEGAERLQAGDLAHFGVLMNESHRSLRDDYEVSSPQLDALVAAAQSVSGVYGSRLTGAGFGGCTVSLVEPAAVESFTQTVSSAYQRDFGRVPDIYVCTASDGARVITSI